VRDSLHVIKLIVPERSEYKIHFNEDAAEGEGASQEEYDREWNPPVFGNYEGKYADAAGEIVGGGAMSAEDCTWQGCEGGGVGGEGGGGG
jgi:hypothetical protein